MNEPKRNTLNPVTGSLTIGTVRIYQDLDSVAMVDWDYGSNETLYIPIREIPNLVDFLGRMSENH